MNSPILAVIPARGGSKGLPRKNIRPLCGLPLLAHSLRCAAASGVVDRTVVSTDDEEIAQVARDAGGWAPFLRPAELSRDDTPMLPVLRHALLAVEALEGKRFEALLLLDPTSPTRMPEEIARAAEMLAADPSLDGVIGCSKPDFNPFWVGVTPQDGVLARAFDGTGYARRQDVPPFYRINGALYLWRRDFLLGAPDADWLTAGRHAMLEIPESRAFSIDDETQLRVLEAVIRSGIISLPWLGSE